MELSDDTPTAIEKPSQIVSSANPNASKYFIHLTHCSVCLDRDGNLHPEACPVGSKLSVLWQSTDETQKIPLPSLLRDINAD